MPEAGSDCDVPSAFILFGAGAAGGTAWEATAVPAPVTRLFPVDSSATVLKFADIDTNTLEDIDIEYVSASGTSTGYGIHIVHGTPGTWPGAGLTLCRCTIRNFAVGLYSNAANRLHIVDSHIVENDIGVLTTGATSTLSAINSEFGGTPRDGGNGQALSLSNTQGAIFTGCEFGNCHRVLDMASGAVSFVACNVETVTGPYAFGVAAGRLSMENVSFAAVTGSLVRNTGNLAPVFIGDNVIGRSGGTVVFDGRVCGYETSVDGDAPVFRNSNVAWRRMTSDFVTTKELHSDRDPLPFGATPEIQRLELSGTVSSATAASGGLYASPLGVDLYSTTAAGSTVVANLSEGNVYAPVMARSGDASISTFDWSRRMMIRFKIRRYDQGSGSTADNQAAILFGVPYSRTTAGGLTDKGIGIYLSNTSVSAVVNAGASVSATATANGTQYVVKTAGTTDFTLIGAADSTVGRIFTATGAGSGTGTVTPVISTALGSIADATKKELVIDYDGAGTLKASLTGHYDVTRAGGPTGDSTAHNNSILLAAWNTTGGTSIPHYSISDLEIAYY